MIPTTSRPGACSVDLSFIKTNAQRQLFKLLDKFEGTKTIVWDERLIGPFEFVANASLLRQHEAVHLYRLNDVRLAFKSSTDYILFFLRKDYQVAKHLAETLHRADRMILPKTSLIFVPQRCASIEKLLSQYIGKLESIEELPIELFLMDTDILSMENEFVYRDMYVNEDFSAVHQIVEGLAKVQEVCGTIPRISGQGKAAKLVCDLLAKRRKFGTASSQRNGPHSPVTAAVAIDDRAPSNSASTQIQQLILIDRRVDLITPLLTQLTYEGLLDEIFGIKHGTITLPNEKFQKLSEQGVDKSKAEPVKANKPTQSTRRFELRSTEELYAKLRDCHINGVADTLKQSARNLQAEYEECNSEGKSIHEMGKIVKRLNHLKMAKTSQLNHVTIAELVNEQTLRPEFIIGLRIEHELLQEDKLNRIVPEIETKLIRQEEPSHVLRLICLHSLVNNGHKPKISDYYKREFIQNYGSDCLLYLMHLEKANLLLCQEQRAAQSSSFGSVQESPMASFGQLKSKFALINDNADECNPNHFAYVYGGYAPLSVMAAKSLATFGQAPGVQWRSAAENLKLLAEPTVTYVDPSTNVGSAPTIGTPTVDGGGGITSNALAATASMLFSSAANAASSVTGAQVGMRVRRNSATSSQSSSNEETRVILVFFIGGCTFAEISALRFLSQQEENNCEFLVGTTKIINGRTFLKSLRPSNSSD